MGHPRDFRHFPLDAFLKDSSALPMIPLVGK